MSFRRTWLPRSYSRGRSKRSAVCCSSGWDHCVTVLFLLADTNFLLGSGCISNPLKRSCCVLAAHHSLTRRGRRLGMQNCHVHIHRIVLCKKEAGNHCETHDPGRPSSLAYTRRTATVQTAVPIATPCLLLTARPARLNIMSRGKRWNQRCR